MATLQAVTVVGGGRSVMTKVRTSLFSQKVPTLQQHPPSSASCYNNHYSTTRHVRKRGTNHYSTTTTRCWRDNNNNNNNKTPSLFSLDNLQQTATSALESSRAAAEETAAELPPAFGRRRPKSASGAAASTKHLQETLTDTSGKALKWIWRWSLAAIFVYGVASALPMAVTKYTMEDKNKKWESRGKDENNSENKSEEASAVGGEVNSIYSAVQYGLDVED